MKVSGDSGRFFEKKSQKYGILQKNIYINLNVIAIEMKMQVHEV
jgi:hypothetical protein